MEYKILIIKNRLRSVRSLKRGLDWFAEHTPLNITVEYLDTDLELSFSPVGNQTYNGVVANGYQNELRKLVPEHKYNLVCFMYGNTPTGVRTSIRENIPLYPDTELIQVIKDTDGGKMFNHEVIHAFFGKLSRRGISVYDPMDIALVKGIPTPYYMNDSLSADPSNRTMAMEILNPYWNIISDMKKSFLQTIMPIQPYKYFSMKEVAGLKSELVDFLDKARGLSGCPYIITSGYRTLAENAKVGGVPNSSHLKGLGVDLAVKDSATRHKIIKGLLATGTPCFIEDCKSHIHVDLDASIHSMNQILWANDD